MTAINRDILVKSAQGHLLGHLWRPDYATRLVLMPQMGIHPSHIAVHAGLAAHNIAIFTVDLLTPRELHFPDSVQNTPLLAERLANTLDLLRSDGDTQDLAVGLYAADHVAPAAVRAAARRDQEVCAVVAENGLIDHAGREYLKALTAPLLVLIQVDDITTAESTRRAFEQVSAPHEMRLIEGYEAAPEAIAWFDQWLLKAQEILPTAT